MSPARLACQTSALSLGEVTLMRLPDQEHVGVRLAVLYHHSLLLVRRVLSTAALLLPSSLRRDGVRDHDAPTELAT